MDRRAAREMPGLRESLAWFGRAAVLLRPSWHSYLELVAGGAAPALVGLVGPMLTKLLMDRVYPSRDETLPGVVVAVILIRSLFPSLTGAARGYYGQVVGAHVQADTTALLVNYQQPNLDAHTVDILMPEVAQSLAGAHRRHREPPVVDDQARGPGDQDRRR